MPVKYGCIAEAYDDFNATVKAGRRISAEQARAAYTVGGSMPKDLALMYWASLEESEQPEPLEVMQPLPSKSSGSTYGACGVRIDGTPEFVDAVLAKLKGFLDGENARTRLGFSRSKVRPTAIKGEVKRFDNSARESECVYIRLHERGREAQMAHALMEGYAKAEPCKFTESIFE